MLLTWLAALAEAKQAEINPSGYAVRHFTSKHEKFRWWVQSNRNRGKLERISTNRPINRRSQ